MTQQKSIKRSKCVILDAMIIITAHELGVWAHMIERLDIVVPSIIVRDEALFYTRKECGIPEDINLRKLITQGKIREIAASVEEIADLQNIFDSIFLSGLHEKVIRRSRRTQKRNSWRSRGLRKWPHARSSSRRR